MAVHYPSVASPSGKSMTLKAYRLSHDDSTVCFWDMKTILGFVKFATKCLPSKRVQNMLPNWLAWLEAAKLQELLHTPAVPKDGLPRSQVLLGTLALLWVLFLWMRKAKDDALKTFSKHMLSTFILAFLADDDFEVNVFLHGERKQVHLDSGRVWLSEFRDGPVATAAIDRLVVREAANLRLGHAPFLDVLSWCSSDTDLQGPALVLLAGLAKVVHARFLEVYGECTDPLTSGYKPRKRSRADEDIVERVALGEAGPSSTSKLKKGRFGRRVRIHSGLYKRMWRAADKGGCPADADRTYLSKYFLKVRMHLHDVKHCSVALDASRLGHKDIMAGVLCGRSSCHHKPVAVIMPPQVVA